MDKKRNACRNLERKISWKGATWKTTKEIRRQHLDTVREIGCEGGGTVASSLSECGPVSGFDVGGVRLILS
jgi:hypothetical protein